LFADGFGIGYIIKDNGIQFSVSSKHRQTKRYVNMLENTLLDLKRLLKSSSSVICGGHHNHIIHPARHAGENDYGDYWGGESVHEASQQPMKSPKKACETMDEQDNGRLFINVVRMNSLMLNDIKKVGMSLHFDDDVVSASSGASDEEGGRHRRDNSTSNDSKSN
jgi:Choline/Carnitine o-acyltransferase